MIAHSLNQLNDPLLWRILDVLPIGAAVADSTLHIIACNQRFAHFTGAPVSALKGFDLTTVKDTRVLPGFRRAQAGECLTMETDYTSTLGNRSGRYRMFFQPFPDDSTPANGPQPVLVLVEDRLRAEADSLTSATESELHDILSITADVYFRGDAEGRFTMVSGSVQQLLGYTPEELIGRPIRSLYVNPAERQTFLQTLQVNGGLIRDFPVQLRRADGTLIWISSSSRVLTDSTGTDIGIEGLVRDITQRRETELRAVRQSNLIEALLNASSDAIMLIAGDGTLLAANRVFAQRFRRPLDDITGHSLYDLFPPEVAAHRRALVDDVLRTGIACHSSDHRQDLVLDNRIYPVAGVTGQTEMVAVFSRDITEQVRAEERNQIYVREIERSNEDLAQFAYVASHDLREPLRTLISYSSLLERRHGATLEAEGREFLGYIRDAARRMNALIEDLLAYSRADQDDAPEQRLDTEALVTAVIADIAFLLTDQGGAVHRETPLPAVLATPGPIRRLFQNLLVNALKYHDPAIAPQVWIGFDGATQDFYVRDNGIGIAIEHQDRIFHLFQRLGPSGPQACPDEGTGIGLAVCKKIVERLHGTIRVVSAPGQGATFRFTLPLA